MQKLKKLLHLYNNMINLHEIWHNNPEHIPKVRGCLKFHFEKSKIVDNHLTEMKHFAILQ